MFDACLVLTKSKDILRLKPNKVPAAMDATQLILTLTALLMIGVAASAFRRSMRNAEAQRGREYANVLYGVWVEIIVTLFPFAVYVVVGAFQNDVPHVLNTPELAVASAVLSGQGILKFLHHAVGSRAVRENPERALFLVVLGLLLFLLSVVVVVCALMVSIKPWFTAVTQIVLLSFSAIAYSALAGGGKLLERASLSSESDVPSTPASPGA